MRRGVWCRYEHVPYEVLVNLVGHINYGGRITDDWDRRMVLTVLMSIINPGLMQDDYPLAPGEAYNSPPADSAADYLAVIGKLPINPHPNVFGLHARTRDSNRRLFQHACSDAGARASHTCTEGAHVRILHSQTTT